MASTIERQIYFYRVDTGYDNSGKPIPFNPIPTIEHVDKLDWSLKGRYWKDENEKLIACWIDSKQMPCKIRLGSIRRSDFPQVEEQGEITPLEISEKSGLLEQTYMVFLEDNIVGCDFNFYGPRITKLPYYLADKAVGIAPPELNFTPLLRQDVYEQLKEFKYLKLFNLKIRSSFADTIKDIDRSLSDAFKAAQTVGEADEIELILRATGRSTGWLSEKLLDIAAKLMKLKDIHFESKKFVVSGYNQEKQKAVELDLLSDKLIIKKSILKADKRSRALNKNSAYNAIISAYNELKKEILSSASIGS